MGKVQSIASADSASQSAASTNYLAIGCSDTFSAAVENQAQLKFNVAGVLSNMWSRVRQNGTTTASTVTSRKNAADGNQTFSISAGATGTFTDTTHTDSIVATDAIAVKVVVGATSTLATADLAMIFAATTNTVTPLQYNYFQTSVGPASVTSYLPIGGSNNNVTNNTTEANAKVRQRKAGTYQAATIHIGTNGRSTATTFKSRKNGVDGTMTVSIASGAGSIGFFSDTTHTDTIAAGDDYNLSTVTGTGTGALNVDTTYIEFSSTNSDSINVCADHNLRTQNISLTRNQALGGLLTNTGTTELDVEVIANVAFTYSELTINVTTNTVTAASTLTLRANAAAAGLVSASVTANGTGVFSDSTHTYVAAATDLMDTRLVTGGTGTSLKTNAIMVWANAPSSGQNITKTLTETIAITDSAARLAAKTRLSGAFPTYL